MSAHLADISSTDPVRLIAHAYTQHMALLAGGQRIRKLVASTLLGLQGRGGVSVFSFEVLPRDHPDVVAPLRDAAPCEHNNSHAAIPVLVMPVSLKQDEEGAGACGPHKTGVQGCSEQSGGAPWD